MFLKSTISFLFVFVFLPALSDFKFIIYGKIFLNPSSGKWKAFVSEKGCVCEKSEKNQQK